MPVSSFESLKSSFDAAGQGQVLEYYAELLPEQQQALLAQLAGIDPQRVSKIHKRALQAAEASKAITDLEPVPSEISASVYNTPSEQVEKWYQDGLQHIANGKVAVILMAGGQGTRLGSSAPKGCFDIQLPSHKALFHLQAQRILKVQELAQTQFAKEAVVPWYVMTSGPTRKDTETFFRENQYFGLLKQNVIFFEQGVLPAMTKEGKIILEEKHQVLSPLATNRWEFSHLLLVLVFPLPLRSFAGFGCT